MARYEIVVFVTKRELPRENGETQWFYPSDKFKLFQDTDVIEEEKEYRLQHGVQYFLCKGSDISILQIFDTERKNAHEHIGMVVVFRDYPTEQRKSGVCCGNVIGRIKGTFEEEEHPVKECYRHYGIVQEVNGDVYTIKTDHGKIVYASKKQLCFTDVATAKAILGIVGKEIIVLRAAYDGEETLKFAGLVGTVVGISGFSARFCKGVSHYVRVGGTILEYTMLAGGRWLLPKKEYKEGCGSACPCSFCRKYDKRFDVCEREDRTIPCPIIKEWDKKTEGMIGGKILFEE